MTIQKSLTIAVDEFEKDNVFVLGHLVVRERQAAILERRLRALQEEIRKTLLWRKPFERLDPRLQRGDLPELHAEWMCQSAEYYRWQQSPDREYWKQHFTWLEAALRIIRSVSPTLLFLTVTDHKTRFEAFVESAHKDIHTVLAKADHPGVNDKELVEIFSFLKKPYATTFAGAMVNIDSFLREQQTSARLICDNYDECKGFSNLELYGVVREHGYMTHISTPEFLSSDDELLIQAVDICTYVYGQHIWQQYNELQGHHRAQDFKSVRFRALYQRYVRDINGGHSIQTAQQGSVETTIMEALFWELVGSKLPKSSELRQELERQVGLKISEALELRTMLAPK